MRKTVIFLEVAYINMMQTPFHSKPMFSIILKKPLIKVVKTKRPILFQNILRVKCIPLFLLITSLSEIQTSMSFVLLLEYREGRYVGLIYE